MRSILALLCLGVFVTAASSAQAAQYGIVDLGMLGGDNTYVRGVNDSAEVVGFAADSQGHSHAFYWSAARGMLELPPLEDDTNCQAWAINNSGLIAGFSGVTGQDYSLFLRTIDGGVTAAGPRYTDARSINEAGQVAGRSDYNTAGIRNADGTFVDLGPSLAYGINNLGEAVGYRYDAGTRPTYRAMYWAGPGSSLDLGAGIATDINDSGWIVGYGYNSALVWDRAGSVRTLPGLPGYGYGGANGINNACQIVGSLAGGLAVLWGADGSVTALPGLPGGAQAYARCIGESGLIAGEARDGSGVYHAVLWQPIPEPSSVFGLLCGLGALVRRRK